MSRHVRVETRSRHQSDLRRVMHSTEKVRKWEKKWVRVEETSLQIFKWMPISKDEEQNQQQQKVSTFSSPQKSSSLSYNEKEFLLRDKKNLDRNESNYKKPANLAGIATPSEMLDSKINGAGDATRTDNSFLVTNIDEQRLDKDNSMITMNTEMTAATTLENPNKRPHQNDEDVVEATNSPQAKRLRASSSLEANKTTDLNSHMLTSMQSVEVPGVRFDMVSSIPESCQATKMSTLSNSSNTVVGMSTFTQQHAPSAAVTNATMSASTHNVANLSSSGGCEAMDAEDIVGSNQVMQTLDTGALTNVTSTPFIDGEDFSSIARNVTEQIVLKVSDCYGGDC